MPALRWYKNDKFDAPELNSPQPCAHGGGCDYKRKDPESGEMVEGCCAFVHPGEEGTGRHLFESRSVERDGVMVQQPACVRLTGGAGYYERRRLKMPWQTWCAHQGIPFTPNKPGEHHEPVKRIPVGGGRAVSATVSAPLLAAKPINAVAKADQGWPVLGGVKARLVDILEETPEEIAEASAEQARKKPLGVRLAWSEDSMVGPAVTLRACACQGVWHSCSLGYESDDDGQKDLCDDCGKAVHDCPERGDHADEKREFAQMMYSDF